MSKNKLKITAEPKVDLSLGLYLGKSSKLVFVVTDVNQDQYRADITLKTGWTIEELGNAIMKSYFLCDALPDSIHILELQLLD